jgi:hypothetical protein
MNGGLQIGGGCECGGAMPRSRRTKGVRHCTKEVMEPSGHVRCAHYAPGPKRGGSRQRARHGTEANLDAAARNPWIHFVRSYAASHRMNYAEALADPKTKAAYHRR